MVCRSIIRKWFMLDLPELLDPNKSVKGASFREPVSRQALKLWRRRPRSTFEAYTGDESLAPRLAFHWAPVDARELPDFRGCSFRMPREHLEPAAPSIRGQAVAQAV